MRIFETLVCKCHWVTSAKNWTLYDIVYLLLIGHQTHFWGIVSLIWRILKHGPKSSLLLHFVVFYLLLLLVDPFFFIAPFECCSSGSQSRPINCQAAEKSKSHSGKYLWFAWYEKKIQKPNSNLQISLQNIPEEVRKTFVGCKLWSKSEKLLHQNFNAWHRVERCVHLQTYQIHISIQDVCKYITMSICTDIQINIYMWSSDWG